MKAVLKVLLACLFFLVLLGLVLFKLVFPSTLHQRSSQQHGTSFPLVTSVNEQDQSSPEIQQLHRAFFNKIINTSQITLQRSKIVYPYAIQDWTDSDKGGEALLKYATSTGWELVTMGGGAWDLPALIQAGVPSDIAQQLAGQ